jgi:hypothetical protein
MIRSAHGANRSQLFAFHIGLSSAKWKNSTLIKPGPALESVIYLWHPQLGCHAHVSLAVLVGFVFNAVLTNAVATAI